MAIYVIDGIQCQKRDNFNSDIEFISVELDIKYVKPIIVTTVHRPSESKVEWFKRAEELISRIDIKGKESILCIDALPSISDSLFITIHFPSCIK